MNSKIDNSFYDKFVIRETGFPFEILSMINFPDTIKAIKNNDEANIIENVFLSEYQKVLHIIMDIIHSEKFKHAVMLSNYEFYKFYIDFLAKDQKHNSKYKYVVNTLVMYIQRFCAKNDTNSFFGPISWGRIVSNPSSFNINLSSKDSVLNLHTFFSYWAASALLDYIVKDKHIVPYLLPQIRPNVSIIGNQITQVVVESNKVSTFCRSISELEGKIIFLIKHNHISIEQLSSELSYPLEDLLVCLKKLENESVLYIKPILPSGIYEPLEYILKWLYSLPINAENYINTIQYFIQQKDSFSKGNIQEKENIIERTNKMFFDLTKMESNRGKGSFYADRYLLYEDGFINYDNLTVGGDLAEDMYKMKLGLKLWMHLSINIWKSKCALFQQKIESLGKNELSIFEYINAINSDYEFQNSINRVDNDIYNKYINLYLMLFDSGKQSEAINELLKDDFGVPYYTSADIQIAADSIDNINLGKYVLVLAECHTNLAFLFNGAQGYWKPCEEHYNQYEEWLNERTDGYSMITLVLKHENKCFTRGNNPLIDVEAYDISNNKLKIPFSDLYIKKVNNQFDLYSKTLNTKVKSHVTTKTLFDKLHMTPFSFPYNYQQPRWTKDPNKRHYNRIQLGRLIFQREHWILDNDSFKGITKMEKEIEKFMQILQIKNNLNMPDRVYVKFESEPKPIYLDFNSYFLIDIFIRKLKNNSGDILISEMLPNQDELWLVNSENQHFTSEFRIMFYPAKDTYIENS